MYTRKRSALVGPGETHRVAKKSSDARARGLQRENIQDTRPSDLHLEGVPSSTLRGQQHKPSRGCYRQPRTQLHHKHTLRKFRRKKESEPLGENNVTYNDMAYAERHPKPRHTTHRAKTAQVQVKVKKLPCKIQNGKCRDCDGKKPILILAKLSVKPVRVLFGQHHYTCMHQP